MLSDYAQTFLRGYKAFSRWLWQARPPLLWYAPCRFHPTCSEYCSNAILKYGVVCGVMKGGWRILRCNPLFPGGIDEA